MAVASSSTGRTAAVLTNAEVFGADCDLQASLDGEVAVDFSFTLGNLASLTVVAYAGPAATPTDALYAGGVKQAFSLTASTEGCFVFNAAGARYFRLGVTGVGDFTDSSCAYTYRYLDYETSSKQDGEVRIG
jgi:hypothetical protein